MDLIKVAAIVLVLGLSFGGCVSTWDGFDAPKDQNSIDIMSLNIHYYVPTRDRTNWMERRYSVTELIQALSPDIILFQEMETFRRSDWGDNNIPQANLQLDWVMSTTEGYTAAAIGDAREFPITQPILFRTSRFELLEQGFFFFSETPDVIYATPWSNQWPSFTSWIRLRDIQTEESYLVINTHLNVFSTIDKTEGVSLILDRIETLRKESKVILAGDFNMLVIDARIQKIISSGMQIVSSPGSSFHFGSGTHLYPSIDHIFLSDDWKILDGGVLQKQWQEMWPSDHHPILARICL